MCFFGEKTWEEREESDNRYSSEESSLFDVFNALIRYRDNLFLQLAYAREEKSELAEKLTCGALDATSAILTECGVEILNQNGRFDGNFQNIVSVEKTSDPEKNLCIISTNREGYRYHSRIIRAQDVTVYQYTKKSE